jgi:hypothetical protein
MSTNVSKSTSGIRRAGTIIRSPIEGRQKDKDKTSDGNLRISEVSSSGHFLIMLTSNYVPGIWFCLGTVGTCNLLRR